MGVLKLEALWLANLPDLPPERVVARAAAFESYLTGTSAPADSSSSEANHADAEIPACTGPHHSADAHDDRREKEETDARDLLIRRAFEHRRVDVATFMAAGMPEWLARAAVTEMCADTENAGFLDKENRLKDWHYFASRYLRMRRDIQAPSVELRTTPQF
ncbi:hypothetical protein FHR71_001194 [Methylobacterium sp. RAS18]|nr:hypothetical protein [Methylobacterium sp. RAS18]